MRHQHISSILCALAAASFLAVSCASDLQESIDRLNGDFDRLEQRVGRLEQQVSGFNDILSQLSVLSAAVEQNFYITSVVTTDDGYELGMSDGSTIHLQNGPGNTLVAAPSISMTTVGGLYYWTLGGVLLTDPSGHPIRTTDITPVLKYDYDSQQIVVSVDGGVTFQSINAFSSVVVNGKVLEQVINNYFSRNSSSFISQQMLYQVVYTYIQRNYSELFDIRILDEVVADYIRQNYTKIFRYELLDEIFSQYDFEYYTSQIDVERLKNVIITFIQEHKEIFADNEVLFQIISSYINANKTTLFDSEMLLDVINTFIENNEFFLDEEMLTQIVSNYILRYRDTVFNTESVRNILSEYVRRYYVQAFTQNMLMQLLNVCITDNSKTFFNETLIREIVNTYITNNRTSVISQDVVQVILNEYIRKNSSTVFSIDVVFDVMSNYFQKNYNTFIDITSLEQTIRNYVQEHVTTILSTEVIEALILENLRHDYSFIYDYELLNQVVTDYFNENTQIIKEYVNSSSDLIKSVKVSGDLCTVTLNNGSTVKLVVYDAYARLRDRVQSVIVIPEADGHIKEGDAPTYLVSPASMANVISTMYYKQELTLELLTTDAQGQISKHKVTDTPTFSDGRIQTYTDDNLSGGQVKTIALHILEDKAGGTDIITEFTPVGSSTPQTAEPEAIDLGLSVKWASFNVGATKPEESGDYFAWGETQPKSDYSMNTYKWYKNNQLTKYTYNPYNCVPDYVTVLNAEDDAATANWGGEWRMPTEDEFSELMNSQNCTWTWEDLNGVQGCTVKSLKNGKSIFLPAVKCYQGTGLWYGDPFGCYPTTSLDCIYRPGNWMSASVYFDSSKQAWAGDLGGDWNFREFGQTVRPVCGTITSVNSISLNIKSIELVPGEDVTIKYTISPPNATYKRITWVSEDQTVATVNDGFVLAIAPGETNVKVVSADGHYATCKVTVTQDFAIPEAVDMGLPGGVKWASFNLGAANPEGDGLLYAWGDPDYKRTSSDFKWSVYLWGDASKNSLTKYNTDSSYGKVDNIVQVQTQNDAARKGLGGSWRLPTKKEMEDLINPSYCSWAVVTVNGKKCYEITSVANGRKLYFPISSSCLWTSTLRTEDCRRGYAIWLSESKYNIGYPFRYEGHHIRPVTN
ncbi:MAG: Ig-like domain-containing protein [Bacteroidales bacterium]|nr:Ig-like domain-containing protein [Bacteroidales bacterium]